MSKVSDAEIVGASTLPTKSSLYESMQAASVVVQAPVVDSHGNHLYIGEAHSDLKGRTVMLHLHHPALGDGQLKPVLKEALRAYLERMDEPGFNPPSLESKLLPSGAILSVVALPPDPAT